MGKTYLVHVWYKLLEFSHTRSNIAYAVTVVSLFMHSPREPHIDAVYQILCYLKSSPGKGLLFSRHFSAIILTGRNMSGTYLKTFVLD